MRGDRGVPPWWLGKGTGRQLHGSNLWVGTKFGMGAGKEQRSVRGMVWRCDGRVEEVRMIEMTGVKLLTSSVLRVCSRQNGPDVEWGGVAV